MKKIVILASGSGTNAENIITYFQGNMNVEVALILTNNREAGVIQKANNHKVSAFYFNRSALNQGHVLQLLKNSNPDLIVLAGFLWKIPEDIIDAFNNKIINIHPALLPNYGGKGMYGMRVHQSVWDNRETETGITIHYVNEHYDDGAIIFQEAVALDKNDTPESIASKVHELEYRHFPVVINSLLTDA